MIPRSTSLFPNRIKRGNAASFFIWHLLFVAALFLPGCQQQPKDDQTQSLVATPDQADVGDIRQHEQARYIFSLHNDTGEVVHLLRLHASCGCTLVKADSDDINAHATGHITVTLAPGDRIGPYQSFVDVTWRAIHSEQTRELRLTLTYNAVRLLKTNPVYSNFGDVNADQPINLNIEVSRAEDQSAWDDMKVTSSKVPIVLNRLSNDRYKIAISIPVDRFPLGILKDDFMISLLKRGLPVEKLKIPFQIRLVSNVEADPPTIYCGMIKLHSAHRGKFSIRSSNPGELRVVALDSSDPTFIRARCTHSQRGELDFEYSTDAQSSQGNHSGNFLVTLQADKKRQILVPFIAYVE